MHRFVMAFAAAAGLASPALAAVEGTATGVFQNPQPGTSVNTGAGTNRIVLGQASSSTNPASSLQFDGTSFGAPFETVFSIGRLTFFNGSIVTSSGVTAVDLAVTLTFGRPAIPAVTTAFTLNIENTLNTGDPDESADFVFFPGSFGSSSFDIDGVRYNVQVTGFGNVVGDGFLTSDSNQFRVRENASASADVFARVTSQAIGAVPEPATWAMMIGGFGLVGGAMRRRSVAARTATC